MKQKFSFWFIIGISIGIVLGFVFHNAGAGMCLGIGSSAIVTLLLNDYDNEH
jgi:Na+/H+-dicarboxylate symporter